MTAMDPSSLPLGVYRHYSGQHYYVMGVARDDRFDDDTELLVIYCRLYGREGVPLCARRLEEFTESVEGPDGPVPRFEYVGYADSDEREDRVTKDAK
jgi:hypothetical protein